MPYVVFLNGPPRCGKDMIAAELTPYLQFSRAKAAAPLKRALGSLLDLDMQGIEDHKETKAPVLQRAGSIERDTVRQALISLSEDWAKVRYGEDFFGRILGRDIANSAARLTVVTDAGFAAEVASVIRRIGWRNCLFIRVHREGCDFTGDSRSYLTPEGVVQFDLHNNKTKYDAAMMALHMITRTFADVPLLKEPAWIR